MASMLSSRAIRNPILSLPPHLRISILRSTRSFSTSPSHRSTLVDFAVAGPSAILDGIHGLGIPWHTAIPLSAVLVRTTLVYYISTRPSRRKKEIQNHLVPLTAAHVVLKLNSQAELQRRAERRKRTQDTVPKDSNILDALWSRWWSRLEAMSKLGKEHGVKRFRPWGLVNFGLLIAFTESIRLKCGTKEGLLPLLLAPIEWIWRQLQLEDIPPPPSTDGKSLMEVLSERLQWMQENNLLISKVVTDWFTTDKSAVVYPEDHLKALKQESQSELATDSSSLSAIDTASPYFDPTMQIEGLSWATNLALPDPTWILPGLLFGTMSISVLLRPSTATQGRTATQGYLRNLNFPQRLGLAVSWLFFFAAINMPSAILLYFVPSLAAGWLQQRWLDWRRPIEPAIQPCKRPIRMKVRKGW